MQADIEFCQESQENGATAWGDRFLQQGFIVLKESEDIVGADAVKNAIQSLYDLMDLTFRWKPLKGGMSDDGTLGYTTGEYCRSYTSDTGEHIEETGKYTTIWRKVKDGEYKIEMDMGN